MTPVGMAMLWRVFPPAERVRASSILVVPTALTLAVRPVLGGVFVTNLSWRWVFFVNVPIRLAALVFGTLFLAEQRLGPSGVFHVWGFLLAGACPGLVIYAALRGSNHRLDAQADPGRLRHRCGIARRVGRRGTAPP